MKRVAACSSFCSVRSQREQHHEDIELLKDALVQIAGHMSRKDAAKIIAPACAEQDFTQNTNLSPYCNGKTDI